MQSKKHTTFFVYLILAALVSTALSRLEERRCVIGKTYFDGCNHCMCSNGRRACTMMSCDVWDPITKTSKPATVIEPPRDFWEPIPDAPLPSA